MYSTKNEYTWDTIQQQLDEFTKFIWRGESCIDHNMFIINENREGLQFFNGGGFSNEYSNPKYQKNNADLLGINFNRQTLKFKVAVYNVTITEYQDILAWLDPTIINYLTFGYDPEYGYLVKLSNLQDSTRYVIGKNAEGESTYYTELELQWDVQGPQCVRANQSSALESSVVTYDDTTKEQTFNYTLKAEDHKSFLDSPVIISVPFFPQDPACQIRITANLLDSSNQPININPLVCCDISFKNLATTKESTVSSDNTNKRIESVMNISYAQANNNKLTLKYDSETALCFISGGSVVNNKLLNFLTTDPDSGEPIIQDMNSKTFLINGNNKYQHQTNLWSAIKFNFILTKCKVGTEQGTITNKQKAEATELYPKEVSIETYARKIIG